MKKWLAILSSIVFLSGCSELSSVTKAFTSPTFSERDLVNKTWYCKSSYSLWMLLTEEYYEYKPNGYALNYGKMTLQKDGHEFVYDFKAEGHWQISGWKIYEKATKSQVKRAFDKKAKQALKNDPALKLWEAGMYAKLQEMSNLAVLQGAVREIESLTPTELTTKVATSYVICAKK